jgi:hypothetical protein
MENKIKELETAKENVRWLLDHAQGLIDMKGVGYWADRVEALRQEIIF